MSGFEFFFFNHKFFSISQNVKNFTALLVLSFSVRQTMPKFRFRSTTDIDNSNFQDVSTGDVMWHYLKTKSVVHMHSLLMYDDLMTKYQHVKDELNILKQQKIIEHGCCNNDTTDITDVPDP